MNTACCRLESHPQNEPTGQTTARKTARSVAVRQRITLARTGQMPRAGPRNSRHNACCAISPATSRSMQFGTCAKLCASFSGSTATDNPIGRKNIRHSNATSHKDQLKAPQAWRRNVNCENSNSISLTSKTSSPRWNTNSPKTAPRNRNRQKRKSFRSGHELPSSNPFPHVELALAPLGPSSDVFGWGLVRAPVPQQNRLYVSAAVISAGAITPTARQLVQPFCASPLLRRPSAPLSFQPGLSIRPTTKTKKLTEHTSS